MTLMKAAILETLNAPLILADVEVPPLVCGQVLVELHYSGICGAQIGEISGVKGEDKFLPHLLGHEVARSNDAEQRFGRLMARTPCRRAGASPHEDSRSRARRRWRPRRGTG